jgi:hypothetical protein
MTSTQQPTPAPQRNAPCPCGSGLRYKHCHGAPAASGSIAGVAPPRTLAPYPGWDRFAPDEQASLWRAMQEALAAQKAGQLDIASDLYAQVVARAPLTFDALHMLGVVRFQQGDLDDAESLLRRASDLMPGFEAIRHNLRLLQQRKREQEGLYSATAIIAYDMLRLFGATRPVPATASRPGFPNPSQAGGTGTIHIVIPGDVFNAAANRNGVTLLQRLAATTSNLTLWCDPTGELPTAGVPDAVQIEPGLGRTPQGGTVALFGINARSLTWLPDMARSFDAIVVGLDAHDPMTYVELIDRIPPAALERVQLVARTPELLADLGLPGTVDSMVFDAVAARPRPAASATRPRIGVFIPPLRGREDKARWEMLEWLRSQALFLRLMYPGRLPSRHIEDQEEHLISLVTDWQDWWQDLDGLFFWGAEGRMRQFDRIVFEGAGAGLAIVADGFGDYGAALPADSRCHLFFEVGEARRAVGAMLAALGRAVVPGLPHA